MCKKMFMTHSMKKIPVRLSRWQVTVLFSVKATENHFMFVYITHISLSRIGIYFSLIAS